MKTINKNRESTQLLICYYDLFSQVVRLKERYEQRSILLFQCSIYRVKGVQLGWNMFSLKTGTYNLLCSRWHKFTTKALLCYIQCVYIVDSDMWLSNTNTHRMNFCSYTRTARVLRASATRHTRYVICTLSIFYGYDSGSELEAWI
jgi:hypothetical protein